MSMDFKYWLLPSALSTKPVPFLSLQSASERCWSFWKATTRIVSHEASLINFGALKCTYRVFVVYEVDQGIQKLRQVPVDGQCK